MVTPHRSIRPDRVGQAKISYGRSRSILTRTSGFLDAYDFSLNPYMGCSFGCTYCYAAFFTRNKEERDNWGYWVSVKENAADSLEKRKDGSLNGKRIYMSSVTDPYQPVERALRLTRRLLRILAERHKPKLVVQTRSPDVVRDIDLFDAINDHGGRVRVNMTITSDTEDVRRAFEPYCPSNQQRLEAVARLRERDIDACVTMTPLLLVADAERFARRLKETGAQHFVAQAFQFQKGHFVAGTREAAQKIMAEKLACSLADFPRIYLEHYARARRVLKRHLGTLGAGKDGFAPPF